MAKFIHIFVENQMASILKNGIKINKSHGRETNGVFVSPLTENYFNSHQWQRELQRFKGAPTLAARIRIPDTELVFIGKYNEAHLELAASEAIGIARVHQDPLGLEVIIPRKIRRKEILQIYKPPKLVGWRFYPQAKGSKPCGCRYCQRGEPFSKKIQEDFKKNQ